MTDSALGSTPNLSLLIPSVLVSNNRDNKGTVVIIFHYNIISEIDMKQQNPLLIRRTKKLHLGSSEKHDDLPPEECQFID